MSISGGGLLALTMLGMLTVRVGNRVAITSVALGLSTVIVWLGVDSELGHQWFPTLARHLPDKFWMHVLVNLLVFALGYALSLLVGSRQPKRLQNLTIWTMSGARNHVTGIIGRDLD